MILTMNTDYKPFFPATFSSIFPPFFLPHFSLPASACLRCESLQMISSRDIVLVSTATIFGAAVSAFAFRRFSLSSSNSSERATTNSCKREAGRATNCAVDDRKSRRQDPYDPTKRKGYLSWDDYFMALAFLSAKRSKDPNRQVGACLVSQKGIILGIGYNGFPRGCSDDKLPWAKKSKNNDPLETKYPYVCHAEVNAILNTNHASAAGQKLYVTMFPCNECAKIIIQAGVSEVIYYVEKMFENSDTTYAASHVLFTVADIKVRRHQPEMDVLLLNFRDC